MKRRLARGRKTGGGSNWPPEWQPRPYRLRPNDRRKHGYLTRSGRERTFYMPHRGDRERGIVRG